MRREQSLYKIGDELFAKNSAAGLIAKYESAGSYILCYILSIIEAGVGTCTHNAGYAGIMSAESPRSCKHI